MPPMSTQGLLAKVNYVTGSRVYNALSIPIVCPVDQPFFLDPLPRTSLKVITHPLLRQRLLDARVPVLETETFMHFDKIGNCQQECCGQGIVLTHSSILPLEGEFPRSVWSATSPALLSVHSHSRTLTSCLYLWVSVLVSVRGANSCVSSRVNAN